MWFADLLFRMLHIFPAIALVGGVFFMRIAYAPAMTELPAPEREAMQERVRKRWSKVVMTGILLLLVSGIYNIFWTMKRFDLEPWYGAIFAVKFLLAFGMFFIASMLTASSERAARFRANMKFWLNVNVALAVLVVMIACVMKLDPHRPKEPAAPAAVSNPAE